MAHFLHKLGEFAFAHPWRIIAGWLVTLGILGFTASYFMEPTSSAIAIPGTDAQKAIDRAGELFPDAGGGTGRLVFRAKGDLKIADVKSDINDLTDEVAKVDGVAQVVSPFVDKSFVSDSGNIAYAQIQLDEVAGSVDEGTIESITEAVENARSESLQVEMGGDIINKAPGEILGLGEVGGVIIALMVLVITLGTLVSAGMPIVTAVVAIGVSMAGLFSLSKVVEISSTTPVLAVMLGLAVGIDYSLFIINKYRSYVTSGMAMNYAAARALGTAGNAVVFAAFTVVIALAALSIVNIPFMTTMGLAGAASIAVAALVSLTLIPALLGLAGTLVLPRKSRAAAATARRKTPKSSHLDHSSFWYRWGEFIVRRPLPVLVAALVVVGFITWPAKHLDLGLPTDQFAAKESTERKAYDLLAKGFGAGFNGPLTIVVEELPPVGDAEREAIRQPAMREYQKQVAAATAMQKAAFQQKMMQAVTPEQQFALQQEVARATAEGEAAKKAALAEIDANVEKYAKLVQLKKVADNITDMDNVAQALPAVATDDGTAGIIQVIPSSAPSDTRTTDLIETLRDPDTVATLTDNDDVTLAVTGSTALQEDINEKLANALPLYLAVVVGLSLLLLVIAFRSILVPLKATAGFLLSVLAMFGALVAVFQWGWFGIAEAPGPIVSFIPIIAIGILFGLAMDYEFFLVSGMHEAYTHTKDAKRAVVNGFAMGSKVVTAAGIIMVSVFAGFIFNHDATIQAIGFGLALGILVDAFIVRMTIVPAVMTLLGKWAWWLPKWLDRRLPHVSIEGEE